MNLLWLLLVAAICAGPALASEVPAWQRAAISLYSHESIVIDRPASAVWPFILNTDRWKRALQHRRVSGTANEIGEVVAESLAAGAAPLFYSETMELVPNVRRTIKLYPANGGPLIGFASWELERDKASTRVTYHVYSESLLTPEDLQAQSPAQLAAAADSSKAQNQQRFRAELQELKRLVESSAR